MGTRWVSIRPERDALAIEIARRDYGDAVVTLGGKEEPVQTMAEIKASGRMPTIEEAEAFYDSIASPRPSDGWFGSNQHISKDFGRVQYALGHIKPGMSVLEAGCADGGLSQHLVGAVGKEGHVTLLDISSVFLGRCQEFISKRLPWATVEYQRTDAATFTTRRRFDVIVAMEILEHVPDPRALIGNLYRLLRKDGKLLISVPVDTEDSLGEHVHDFKEADIAVILGDATGQHVTVERQGNTLFAAVDKGNQVAYVR